MIIYLDLLFLKEILFNSIIIFLTGKIINQRIKISKIIISSLIGAIYTISILVLNPNLYSNSIIQLICAILIIITALENETIYEFMKNITIFYIVTYTVGGICTYTQTQNKSETIYIIIFILMFPKIIQKYKAKYKLESYYGELTIKVNNKKEKLKTLIDTGHNLLTCYNEPVIILSNKFLLNDVKEKNKKRRISYNTINEEEVCVNGIKEEGVELEYRKERYINDAVIITSNICFEKYDAIIGLDFFEKARKNNKKEKRKENGNLVFNKK